MAEATSKEIKLALKLQTLATNLYDALQETEKDQALSNVLGTDWNKIDFVQKPMPFDGPTISNFLGTIEFFRKFLRNEDMSGSKGDHLTNTLKMSAPLGE